MNWFTNLILPDKIVLIVTIFNSKIQNLYISISIAEMKCLLFNLKRKK